MAEPALQGIPESVMKAEVIDVPQDGAVGAPSIAAAAAILNQHHPRAATVAEVVCALHEANPAYAERALALHEHNAAHIQRMDEKAHELAEKEQDRIAKVEMVGAFVIPGVCVLFAATFLTLVAMDASRWSYPGCVAFFSLICWIVKVRAENVKMNFGPAQP